MDVVCERVLSILHENKADDVVCLDVRNHHSLFSFMIIASSKTAKHSTSLVNMIVDEICDDCENIKVEGSRNWTSIDLGHCIVHVFLPEVRKYYDIESKWSMT